MGLLTNSVARSVPVFRALNLERKGLPRPHPSAAAQLDKNRGIRIVMVDLMIRTETCARLWSRLEEIRRAGSDRVTPESFQSALSNCDNCQFLARSSHRTSVELPIHMQMGLRVGRPKACKYFFDATCCSRPETMVSIPGLDWEDRLRSATTIHCGGQTRQPLFEDFFPRNSFIASSPGPKTGPICIRVSAQSFV